MVDDALLAMKYPEASNPYVVEAKLRVCVPPHVFEVVVPRAVEMTLPAITMGYVAVYVVPLPPVMHTPLTEKHLPEVVISTAPVKEEVAELVIFNRLASIPPAKVEVAVEVVALKYEALTKLSKEPMPATESFANGVVVPMPTLPPVVANQVFPLEENKVVEAKVATRLAMVPTLVKFVKEVIEVVASHAGTPLTIERIVPFVPVVIPARGRVPPISARVEVAAA